MTEADSHLFRGLSPQEADRSRALHGSNVLSPPAGKSPWREFLEKFSDPLIIVLLVAGLLSVGISFYEFFGLGHGWKVFFEPVGIFVAILLATGLAFIFEHRANRAFRILNEVNDDEPVTVFRSGDATSVPRRDIVVGDVVILNCGDEIPADGRLVRAVALSVDESSLTGEPLAHKTVDPAHFDPEATYPSDRVLRGTKIMEGHGVMEVLAVGDATETGKVLREARIDSSVKTPLNEQLEHLAALITRASYLIAALIILCRMVAFFGTVASPSWIEILAYSLKTVMVAVTLIVVAVPEGLPMAVTLSLAYSMSRMLRTNNLVRRLHACETMGAATVICTDKTGTLTRNRMEVHEINTFSAAHPDILDDNIALNSTARLDFSASTPRVLGNPTEGALLLWLRDRGVDYLALRRRSEVIAEIPFSTERKFMATLARDARGRVVLLVKGAPEIVMQMCLPLPSAEAERFRSLLAGYQQAAMRTLAFAYRIYPDGNVPADIESALSDGLQFQAVAAISDPVRSDVPAAVAEVKRAGIEVKIVTGDTPGTAGEIARRIGLLDDSADSARAVITGPEFEAIPDELLPSRIPDIRIIARARPMDKKRLVEALQAAGEVVAVTGDGTNDAPALKAAHVGLSMGDGTSVAKEASDITIIDNSFASIGRAVLWGRSLYKNIRRFLLFQLTVNVSACLLVLFGSFIGPESPLSVTQMLWVNLIMDTFGAMALASLPPSPSVMLDAPRPRRASILSRDMISEIFGVGLVLFIVTFAFYWLCCHADISSVTDIFRVHLEALSPLSPYEATLLFSIFVWTHFWYMFDARSFDTKGSIFSLPLSSGFRTIAFIIVAGQLFITELAYDFFNVSPMIHTLDWRFNPSGTLDLVIIVAASSLVLLIREAARALKSTPEK